METGQHAAQLPGMEVWLNGSLTGMEVPISMDYLNVNELTSISVKLVCLNFEKQKNFQICMLSKINSSAQ